VQWLSITYGIVHGPAYLVYFADLKSLSEYSSIFKYADDAILLVSQCSSVSLEEEFQYVH